MQEIYTTEEWDDLLEQSNEVPVLLMKHSSTCPISSAAFNAYHHVETDLPKYYLVVQKSRPLSREIEQDMQIRHESPQLFLLKDGKVVWQATHYSIREPAITQAIQEYYA
ncbi:bacillithiol system redox-active protein YtxJ [Sporosarcina obsidiansis]|uniref:bacillithiol system redox-active protein YtxJ n=1 Tax=Sporosarcina obsidiansis TaxID=2660748 RepID=UPI00129A818D|nr:bacillithiol system redox-active protein YtxJ [Sporosarcina obsidiansis]